MKMSRFILITVKGNEHPVNSSGSDDSSDATE